MTMKVTVGISRKVGRPNYGSAGASCHIDVEVDQSLLSGDRQQLQRQVQQALAVCRSIVDDELSCGEHAQSAQPQAAEPPAIGQSSAGYRNGSPPRPATPAQVKALHAIAGKAGLVLASELERQFGVQYPQQLTLAQASAMIDRLKAAATPQPA